MPTPSWVPKINGVSAIVWMDFARGQYYADGTVYTIDDLLVEQNGQPWVFNNEGLQTVAPNIQPNMKALLLGVINALVVSAGGYTGISGYVPNGGGTRINYFLEHTVSPGVFNDSAGFIDGSISGGTQFKIVSTIDINPTENERLESTASFNNAVASQPFQQAFTYRTAGPTWKNSLMGEAVVTWNLIGVQGVLDNAAIGNHGVFNGIGTQRFFAIFAPIDDGSLPTVSTPSGFPKGANLGQLILGFVGA